MEINIADLLRNAPKGIQLYSRTLGPCTVDDVSGQGVICNNNHGFREFYRTNGKTYSDGEVILFPKKDVSWEDWTVLLEVGHIVRIRRSDSRCDVVKIIRINGNYVETVNKSGSTYRQLIFRITGWASEEEIAEFNKPGFKPYDKVIVRNDNDGIWFCNFYAFYDVKNSPEHPHYTISDGPYSQCVPFNEKTKHLIGTSDPYQG